MLVRFIISNSTKLQIKLKHILMIGLNSYSPLAQKTLSLVKNSLKESVYFRQNYLKIKSKKNTSEEKPNLYHKPHVFLPKQSSFVRTKHKEQHFQSFVRSKTQVSIAQTLQKDKIINNLPVKLYTPTDKKQPKKKRIDPQLRLIAKTLVYRKSHKYYLYAKNKRSSQQITTEKPSFIQTTLKKADFFVQPQQQDKKLDDKLRKRYKLLQLTGCKINLQDLINMQHFNNSSLYLKSNSDCYCD